MKPQNVIICAFAFACAIIIGGGLIFGAKRHASPIHEASPVAALDENPAKSEQSTAIEPGVSKPETNRQDAAPTKPIQPKAVSQDRSQSLPIVVTYEFKRKRETDSVIARDPKGFWIRQIVAKIEDKKIELPKPLEQPVAVQVEFVIGHDGTLLSKAVKKSSGSDEADKTAIAMLEHAQPFPPMPEGLHEQELTFNLPVRFR